MARDRQDDPSGVPRTPPRDPAGSGFASWRILNTWPFRPLFDEIRRSNLRTRLARGAFWALGGAVISRGLTLISLIVVARLVGKTSFGELGIIQSTVGLFQVFAGFGMGLTATKHVAEFHRKDPARAGRIIALSALVTILMSAVVAGVMMVLAPTLASRVLAAPHLAGLLRVGCVMLFFGTLSGVQAGILTGFEAFKPIARVSFVVGLLSFPLVIAGAWWGGLEGAIWGLVAASVAHCLIGHLAVRAEARRWQVPISLRGWRGERRVLWRFGLPAALSAMMVPPVHWICNAMLVNQPHGYGEMAIYSAGNQWRIALLFLPAYLSVAVLPVLSDLYGQGDRRRYMKVLWFNTAVNAGATLPAFLLIWLCAPWIMICYGPGFEEGRPVLVLLAFTACLMSLSNSIGKAILSSGSMWSGLLLNTLWAAAFITLTRAFLEKGALGLAQAMLIAYALHLFLGVLYTRFVLFGRRFPAPGEGET